MKLIMNKKNSGDSITLDLESTAAVNELLLIHYSHRGKIYEQFSFADYQKFISVYQCLLYGDRFKNKLLPGTRLADYPLEDPCTLIWEEFTENRCLLAHIDPGDSRVLFWQASTKASQPEIEKESLPVHGNNNAKSGMP